MATLESELTLAQQDNQELQDQILWYKASLKASRLELDEMRQKIAQQSKNVQHLQTLLDEQKTQTEKWRTTVSQTIALMHMNESRMKQLQIETDKVREDAAALVAFSWNSSR